MLNKSFTHIRWGLKSQSESKPFQLPEFECDGKTDMARICAENPSKEVKEMGLTADQKNATVFTVKVDDCRTQNWTCVVVVDEVANKEVMYEPDFGDDPMFPTVGHLLTIQMKRS